MNAGTAPEGGFVLSARLPLDRYRRMSMRVLVADDQSMVRAGFRMLLAGEAGHRGRRGGEQRARGGRQGGALPPDRRPDGHPHARARRARGDAADPRRRDNGARILILTTFDLDEYVYEALRAGASGFVLKDDPPEQLIERDPHRRRRRRAAFARGHEARDQAVHAPPAPQPPKELEELTTREQEVFRLIAPASPTPRSPRALHQRSDGQDAHHAHPPKARPSRPRPGGRARLPDGALRERLRALVRLRSGARDGDGLEP